MKKQLIIIFAALFAAIGIKAQQPVYEDLAYWQDKSDYVFADKEMNPDMKKVFVDRNYVTQILSTDNGVLRPSETSIVLQRLYRPLRDWNVIDMILYKNEYVYLTDKAVISDAWAGKLYVKYDLPDAKVFDGGANFDFLVGSDDKVIYVDKTGKLWDHKLFSGIDLIDIRYDKDYNGFWILTDGRLCFFDVKSNKIEKRYEGRGFRAFTLLKNHSELVIATDHGYEVFDKGLNKVIKSNEKLPCVKLISVAEIDGRLWFGSENGAFMLKDDGKFNYYASRRWIPDNEVRFIAKGLDNSILILTSKGLATIQFNLMTLYDKAMVFERQVRQRHTRDGFNCDTYAMSIPGDLSSGTMVDSDNDGLWTSMYLASQLFRYAVTKSPEAYENSIQGFEAMERLHNINPVEGFPSRSYERTGYILHGRENWHKTEDGLWEWKGTTSSDEAIGHYLAFALTAEIIEDEDIKQRAIHLIDIMTNHILEHDLYFYDVNGKPTQWGRWNPDYVNHFPKSVGDRKLNSSNIIAFLQTAYHFTGKEKYRKKAMELMDKYGYLENLMRPMEEIGKTDGHPLAAELSDAWNHSDDEMYFLSYWYLYPYAFNNDLKQKYKEAIRDHWQAERPEKDALWNFCYAMTGADKFDLDESVWWLREFPLDLIDWSVNNSHRKDIELLPPNFRNQTTKEVLPPDERPMYKHNTNMFEIDRNGGGRSEYSGDLYLLPYWMGRYLGVISAPAKK